MNKSQKDHMFGVDAVFRDTALLTV